MIPIGPFVRIFRGSVETAKIRYDIKNLNKRIEEYSEPNAYINKLAGLDRIEAQNNLIMAEYILNRSKIDNLPSKANKMIELWERTKIVMNAKIMEAQTELKSMGATKLDIARLITSLTQISGEFDKELISIKGEVDKELASIKEEVNTKANRLDKMIKNTEQNLKEQINTEVNKLDKLMKNTEQNLKKVRNYALCGIILTYLILPLITWILIKIFI